MAKKVTLYGILAALCLIFGYLESLFSLSFIAPGVKLGLANSIALLLLCYGDFKGALSVNIIRILLTAILFGTPFSLLFSFTAGIISLLAMRIFMNAKSVSAIGFSVLGAAVHNTVQITVASLIFGGAVWYYWPVLLISSIATGSVVGIIVLIILKKVKTNRVF